MSLRITQTQRYNDCCPCFKRFWHFFVYTFNLVFSCKISPHRIGESNYRFAPFRKFRNACSNLMDYSEVGKPMMPVIRVVGDLKLILKIFIITFGLQHSWSTLYSSDSDFISSCIRLQAETKIWYHVYRFFI